MANMKRHAHVAAEEAARERLCLPAWSEEARLYDSDTHAARAQRQQQPTAAEELARAQAEVRNAEARIRLYSEEARSAALYGDLQLAAAWRRLAANARTALVFWRSAETRCQPSPPP